MIICPNRFTSSACARVCACVCVCVREGERDNMVGGSCGHMNVHPTHYGNFWTISPSPRLTNTQTLFLSLSHTHTLSLTHTYKLTLSLSHTQSHTQTHIYTLSLCTRTFRESTICQSRTTSRDLHTHHFLKVGGRES